MTELETVAAFIEAAQNPEDIFGNVVKDRKAIATTYKHLISAVHPDHFVDDPALRPTAEKAFKRLTELKGAAERKFDEGTYGDRKKTSPPPAAPLPPLVVQVRGRKYQVDSVGAWRGDICDLYPCRYLSPDDEQQFGVMKVAQHPSDNDLVQNEAATIKKVYKAGSGYEKYFVEPVDSFMLKSSMSQRFAVVMKMTTTDFIPLSDVLEAFPNGIDFRDMVWMFKRLLTGLGYVHRQGIVHGAVLPSHVMIHKVNHGAKIIDWCYAVPAGGKVKAMSSSYLSFYAPEIRKKELVTSQTDIYMAAKIAVALLGGKFIGEMFPKSVPRPIQSFFKGILLEAPTKRPDDAWALHEELDILLRALVGPPKYRAFEMP